MLYVGQFSFDVAEGDSSPMEYDRGFFTTLVEAGSAEEAVEKFENLIRSADDSEPFEGVGDVYLDVAIEVRELPEEGLITYIEHHEADGSGSLSMVLPEAPPESAAAFSWGQEPEEGEEYTATPFMPLED
jgi:hypothetical protein